MIYYGRQDINEADIQAVEAVLRSDFLTQGPAIERFERRVADYCGAKYAVAVCNATAALHIACLAAGMGKGDVLWTTPITFVASANCALYCGSDVDFIDIDAKTYNMNADLLEDKLRTAKAEGKLPKMVIPVICAAFVHSPMNMALPSRRMPLMQWGRIISARRSGAVLFLI